jgi:hypothetical protein
MPVKPKLPEGAPDGAIPLPKDGWVLLRDPETVTQGDVEDMLDKYAQERDAGGLSKAMQGIKSAQALLALAIDSWSLPEPLPADDPTVFRRLPAVTYNAISKTCEAFDAVLFPKTDRMDPADTDRKGPSGPSSD